MNNINQVLPIISVTDVSGRDYFINVYQIICVNKLNESKFNLRLNNHGTITCPGSAEDFIGRIKKQQ